MGFRGGHSNKVRAAVDGQTVEAVVRIGARTVVRHVHVRYALWLHHRRLWYQHVTLAADLVTYVESLSDVPHLVD